MYIGHIGRASSAWIDKAGSLNRTGENRREQNEDLEASSMAACPAGARLGGPGTDRVFQTNLA